MVLRPIQWRMFSSPARFIVAVAGRRGGKSHFGCVWSLSLALEGRDRIVYFVFTSYRQARNVAWSKLKRMAAPWTVKKGVRETDMEIQLLNGSLVALRGADKPDSLRGVGLHGAVIDEYADQAKELWVEVIRPALADNQGRALIIGTPKGWNHFRDVYVQAREREAAGDKSWASFHYTTLEGGNVTPEEIESAHRDMDERTFRQEFLASFESIEGRVFHAFSREPWPSGNVASHVADLGGGTPVRVGMDFNINPMTAILWSRVGDEMHVWGELVLQDSNTPEMADRLRGMFGGREVIVYPDPSGKARKSAARGETDFSILRDAGFTVLAPESAPLVRDRINHTNGLLCNSEGRRRLLIHPDCRQLIAALDGLTYSPGTSEPDKKSGMDHPTDALGYAVEYEFPIGGKPRFTVKGMRR